VDLIGFEPPHLKDRIYKEAEEMDDYEHEIKEKRKNMPS
jgi:hypothetical protein